MNNVSSEDSLPKVLPILWLSDCVLFPEVEAPLLIDDPIQMELIADSENGDGYVGAVLQRSSKTGRPKAESLFHEGCLVKILSSRRTSENLVHIQVKGIARFRIDDFTAESKPWISATVVYLDDIYGNDSDPDLYLEYNALTERLMGLFTEYAKLNPGPCGEIKALLDGASSSAVLTNQLAFNLPLSLREKQNLLSTQDTLERLNVLIPLLTREIKVVRLGAKIQQNVTTNLAHFQREHYLREQLRAIHQELGDNGNAEVQRLRGLLKKNLLPEEASNIAHRELERLEGIQYTSPEYEGIRNYLDWLVNLPWNTEDECPLDMEVARRVLNQHHYGLAKVKERLLEYLAVIKMSGAVAAPILCLVGPPGIGKTSLGESVAEALGRKFYRITLGGAQDVSEIRGHRRTYVSAQPGRLIQALRRLNTRNPVILLDEVDKIGTTNRGAETSAALLEILDPNQNSAFTDYFIEVPFDLSHVLFIATANWLEPIHPALRDRMEIIEIPSYTYDEKQNIARKHVLPELLKRCNLPGDFLTLEESALQRLIEQYTHEGGVRGMVQQLDAIIRKFVLRHSAGGMKNSSSAKKIIVTESEIENLLGRPPHFTQTFDLNTGVGVAIGLAWTPQGGDAIPIEATRIPCGRGELILTGNLGKIISESVRIALSFLRSSASFLRLSCSEVAPYDLHVNVPSASMAKDGSSAGITFAVALASLFSNKPVRPGLAMSGEITLHGRLLPVTGISEKVLAAIHHGITEIILPKDNEADWLDIAPQARKQIKALFYSNARDAIQYALNHEK